MEIKSFKDINYTKIKEKHKQFREIGYSVFENVFLIGRNMHYPNVLFYTNDVLVSPYDEKIMSLNKDTFYDMTDREMLSSLTQNIHTNSTLIDSSVFFLIYNFDNYYHFLYDTLPYLYTYLKLKNDTPELKLLINYPNKYKKELYRFNSEFLEYVVSKKDIIIHDENNVYKKIYVSTSLTHGGLSNNPPNNEIYEVYNKIKQSMTEYISNDIIDKFKNYKKIYVSRRTWINNDKSNIGTDYTSRRKMINENDLVEKLIDIGFTEVFTENLSTSEKIYLFNNADVVVGSIGGGMANLLFARRDTKSIILITPYFLDINFRFKFSMENTDFTYFDDVRTYKEKNEIPLFCRAKITNKESKYFSKIGEIVKYDEHNEKKYHINISTNDVAGFNNSIKFDNDLFDISEFELLDKGLNSPYVVNIEKIINLIGKHIPI